MAGKRRILKWISTVISIIVCVLTVGIIGYVGLDLYRTMSHVEKPESGNGWYTSEGKKKAADIERVFDGILSQIEEQEKDVMHVNSLLAYPAEYGIWSTLQQLKQVDSEVLSEDKRLIYEKLMYSFEMYERWKKLPDYAPLFSDTVGPLSTVPEMYYTCVFKSVEDIEKYLELLEQAPKLFEQFLERVKGQAALGFLPQKAVLKDHVDLCRNLTEEKSIFLTDFSTKIEACIFLSEREKADYLRQNERIVKEKVFPVISEIERYLDSLTGEEQSRGLGEYAMGVQYFEYLLEINTGSGMNAEEMFQYLEKKRTALAENVGQGFGAIEKEAVLIEEVLDVLFQKTKEEYLWNCKEDWTICQIPELAGGRIYSAFFTRGILDNGNYIYVGALTEDMSRNEIWQIAAHEAFPGHMYWYSENSGRMSIEQLVKCPGYSEGWAVAAEYAAGEWLQEGKEDYLRQVNQQLYDELVLCQADIGIHAMGWDIEELKTYLQKIYGYSDQTLAEEIFSLLAENAGSYESYVCGYFQFLDLKQYCMEKLGMGEKEFRKFYLEVGQTPFIVLKAFVESFAI